MSKEADITIIDDISSDTKIEWRSHKEYKDIVERASLFLDKEYPKWFLKIDLTILRINHCSKCIVGQLLNNQDRSQGRITLATVSSSSFYKFIHEVPVNIRGAFGADNSYYNCFLQKEWNKSIKKRRNIYHEEKNKFELLLDDYP